ncbi:hypothetical protein TH66_22865 [Carbonactinospora thermoautotrophica]|uniref:Transcriptional regulator n=1 Tax=Carbonactinospora thermoautotrophica TaxID=1469144 RepID=A0A132NGQ0_9ACTN|nr:hypothetical protein [Carbonactinospora thermoautotrophica]KWW98113.1 hypothetical protein TH66_22865 [Carbonactinospora thermoautotrophica]KWX09258.1 hypothetical protein TR74_10690 [Carbonactinospora thermoautotrophica]
MATETNEVLARYLAIVGWSPRALACRVNRLFGAGTVSPTAPYHWRDAGSVPRPPVPKMAAIVLSRPLGKTITVEELWKGQAQDSPLLIPADHGMDAPWTLAGTVRIVEDWLLGGLMDRREFLAISGSALTTAGWDYLGLEPTRLAAALGGDTVGDTLTRQIETMIPSLRDADHRRGGLAGLPYVHAQFLAVGALLREGGHSDGITRRLLVALGELGDLAGYMAFDAGRHGLAQRYWLTALRAAREAGDQPLAASILGNLSYQATWREDGQDAVSLGEAAVLASTSATASVRAAATSRLASAYAANGQLSEFRRAAAQAREILENRRPAHDPGWAEFVSPDYLQAQSAYSLIQLGRARLTQDDRAGARKLLTEGETRLASDRRNDAYRRSDLLRNTWLALGYTARGDLERSCSAGRVALQGLAHVRSARCVELLRALRGELRRGRHTHPWVREFLPELDAALRRHAA